MLRIAAVAALLLSAAPAALAQTPPPAFGGQANPVEAGEDRVIVRGEALREAADNFVDHIAEPSTGRGYARWHRSLCVAVANLQNDAAQYVVDRVSEIALEVGLNPGDPGCRPQLLVVFTPDGRQTANAFVESEPMLFQTSIGGTSMGADVLQHFRETDAAVRWWLVTLPRDARTGQRAIWLPGDDPTQPIGVNVAGPSRIHAGVRDDLEQAIVLVDVNRMNYANWTQIADYIAMVGLAQIDPLVSTRGYDSILNLFDEEAPAPGLTDWDRSYLKALYEFDQERRPELQGIGLVRAMTDIQAEANEARAAQYAAEDAAAAAEEAAEAAAAGEAPGQ